MSPTKGEQRTVEFRAEGDDEDWTWRANWHRTTFDGWRKLNWKEIEEDSEEVEAKEEEWKFASTLKPGDKLKWLELQAEPHQTKAPARYTEASLIKDLEEKGIGRPSTFAMLVSTIIDKGYVEKKDFIGEVVQTEWLKLEPKKDVEVLKKETKRGGEKDRMVPTTLGDSVLKYLLSNFQELFAYEFTARMEKRLDEIAEGKQPWKQVLRDTWTSYKDKYEEQLAQKKTKSDLDSERRRELGENIVAITTKKGPLLLKESPDKDKEKTIFYGWPTTSTSSTSSKADFTSMTLEKAKEFIAINEKVKAGTVIGEIDGFQVVKKKGPYGHYAEWNGKRVSCQEDSIFDAIKVQLQTQESATLKKIGQFEIRKGPYGLYMFKSAAAKKEFVSVPAGTKLDELTEPACIALFQAGLQQKAKARAYGSGSGSGSGRGSGSGSGNSSRGGFRGRGGYRGRGRGSSRGGGVN